MVESVAGDLDLTEEQLETLAAEVKEKNWVYHADYYQREVTENYDNLRARQRKADLRFKQNALDKVKKNQQNYSEKRKASKKYHCTTCNVTYIKPYEFARHNASKGHLEEVDRQRRNAPAEKKSASAVKKDKAMATKKYFCSTCNVPCSSQWELNRHNGSKRHLKKVAASSSRST
jgi:hypothetical protein